MGASLRAAGTPPTAAEMCTTAACILQCCARLHRQRIMHLDLKPANILVNHVGGQISAMQICDFNLSQFAPHRQRRIVVELQTIHWRAPELLFGCDNDARGPGQLPTVQHAAHNRFDGRLDVWSIGMMVLDMHANAAGLGGTHFWKGHRLTSHLLMEAFGTNANLAAPQRKRGRSTPPHAARVAAVLATMAPNAADFARLLLTPDPTARPTLAQALAHPYVCGTITPLGPVASTVADARPLAELHVELHVELHAVAPNGSANSLVESVAWAARAGLRFDRTPDHLAGAVGLLRRGVAAGLAPTPATIAAAIRLVGKAANNQRDPQTPARYASFCGPPCTTRDVISAQVALIEALDGTLASTTVVDSMHDWDATLAVLRLDSPSGVCSRLHTATVATLLLLPMPHAYDAFGLFSLLLLRRVHLVLPDEHAAVPDPLPVRTVRAFARLLRRVQLLVFAVPDATVRACDLQGIAHHVAETHYGQLLPLPDAAPLHTAGLHTTATAAQQACRYMATYWARNPAKHRLRVQKNRECQ
jgi:hypothetical protein